MNSGNAILPVPSQRKLPITMDRALTRVREARRETQRKFSIERRASSFPICPRGLHLARRLKGVYLPQAEESFMSHAATLMGTALHVALQHWFGIAASNSFYGNWVCMDCRRISRHKFGIQKCSKCGHEMVYKEYAITASKSDPYTGHIDGLFKDFIGDSKRYLLDFKGSSNEKIIKVRRTGKPFYEHHYYQTNAYANVVNKRQKVFGNFGQLDGIIILYVDRGTPHRNWHGLHLPISKKIYRQTVALINEALESLEDRYVPNGFCSSPSDPTGKWCRLRDLCFLKTIESKLMDKARPEKKSTGAPSMLERAVALH